MSNKSLTESPALSTESMSSTTIPPVCPGPQIPKSQSDSGLLSKDDSALTRAFKSESNLVLMPGDPASGPLDETKLFELRSKVSLSALQSQLERQQTQTQTQSLSQNQSQSQSQSRHLHVSSSDAKLFQQLLREVHETTKLVVKGSMGTGY